MRNTKKKESSTSLSESAESELFPAEESARGWWGRYEERMQRVVAYVYAHLDEPLDLMKLSEVAGMSAFHWHRVFQSMYGESMVSTVKRLRLHRAAGELANSNRPIGRVAQAAGYPNVQSFTRVFKGAYGLPPAQYRERGAHADFKVQTHAEDLTDRPVEIRELDAMQLVSVPHRGSYMHIGAAFDQLFGRLAARGLARPGMRLIALFYDDPSVIPEGDPGLFNAKSCQAVPTRLALTSRAFDERP